MEPGGARGEGRGTRESGAAIPHCPEAEITNRDSTSLSGCLDLPRRARSSHRIRWRERVLVLGPLGIAIAATAAGAEQDFLAALWLSALAWMVLASLALAIVAGLRRGDWSAFRDYRHGEDREEDMDLDTRTGRYAFMRERDLRIFCDHADRLH